MPPQSKSALTLNMFGPPQLIIKGEMVKRFRTYKIRDLLIYLVTNPYVPHSRDYLATLLWSNYPDQVGRTNLRNTLSLLKKLLSPLIAASPSLFVTTRHIVQFNPDPQIHHSDTATFALGWAYWQSHEHQSGQLCTTCVEHLAHIVEIYRAPFLDNLSPSDESLFSEWRLAQQPHFHQQILTICQALSKHFRQQKRYGRAQHYLQKVLQFEPWQEEGHRALMEVLALDGQHTAALAQYERCKQLLADELAMQPSQQTTELYKKIRDRTFAIDQDTQLQQAQTPTQIHNLPVDVTTFLGRESEIEQLGKLWENHTYRLISLIGSGGMGKTRLSITAARHHSHLFPDGVWFIPLAGIDGNLSPEQVKDQIITAAAKALNLTIYDTEPHQAQLIAALQRKTALLIFDNFEHLLPRIEILTEIYQQVPSIWLLVTSREALNIEAEYLFMLQGLPVPNLAHATTALADFSAGHYSSLQLFIERANRARHGFQLTLANQQAIIDICHILDGLPLGIELAAAWVKMMSCTEIAQEIAQDLDFLTSTKRDTLTRHRSLRVVFDHSWRMLSQEEQLILCQLSVFRGDFDQTAVYAVIGRNRLILLGLIDKSLLHVASHNRYQLHELLRQFVSEKFNDLAKQTVDYNERLTTTSKAHARYYLTFVHSLQERFNTGHGVQALAEIHGELKNIRHAWHSAVTTQQFSLIEQCCDALLTAYHLSGLHEEGLAACNLVSNQLLSLQENSADLPRPQQRLLGHIFIKRISYLNAQSQIEEALKTIQDLMEIGEHNQFPLFLAEANMERAKIEMRNGNYEQAKPYALQGAAHSNGRFPHIEASSLKVFGTIHFEQGDFVQAKSYDEKALEILMPTNNLSGIASTLSNIGHAAMCVGSYMEAQAHLERALQLLRQLGHRSHEAICLENLGTLYYRLQRYTLAQEYLEASLKIHEQVSHSEGQGYALTYLGCVALGLNQLGSAEKYFERAHQIRVNVNQPHLLSEDEAGLAEVALRRGEFGHALAQVEKILAYSTSYTLKGEDIFRVYLTSYRVLQANSDGRAQDVLNTAYTLLQNQIEKIKSEPLRYSFINNVTEHRELIQAWTHKQAL